MQIVISGASGFLGRMLVLRLRTAGHSLALVGRDIEELKTHFPEFLCLSYEHLSQLPEKADIFLHLAAANNNCDLTQSEIYAANVELTVTLAEYAISAGVKRFVNVSSIHALDAQATSDYAISKREAAHAVSVLPGLDFVNLFLPTVYGERFSGNLSRLNSMPKIVIRLAMPILAAVKPVLHVNVLAEWIMEEAPLANSTTILTEGQADNAVFKVGKRGMDLIACFGLGLGLSWLLLLIWIAIRFQGNGSAIFAQRRVGRGGKNFVCYKFRTMHLGTEQVGTHDVSETAVTRIGRILRKLKLDELPQLWNVLKGEMSLIGPRPCLPVQAELVKLRQDAGVLSLRPGISGLAQVNDVDMSDPALLVEWDERYLRLQGLALDVKLALRTAMGRGRGDRIR